MNIKIGPLRTPKLSNKFNVREAKYKVFVSFYLIIYTIKFSWILLVSMLNIQPPLSESVKGLFLVISSSSTREYVCIWFKRERIKREEIFTTKINYYYLALSIDCCERRCQVTGDLGDDCTQLAIDLSIATIEEEGLWKDFSHLCKKLFLPERV